MPRIIFLFASALAFLFVGFAGAAEEYDPPIVYLTWQRQPDTTMTVQWITPKDRSDDLIEYKLDSETDWHRQKGTHNSLPGRYPFFIHRIELSGLNPESTYYFRVGAEGKIFKFRTLPAVLKGPLQFVSGGDLYHDTLDRVARTNKEAAKKSPQFALIGGDIAYSGRKLWFLEENGQRWIDWLILWKKTMVTPEGYLIPILPAIGNHETNGRFFQTYKQAPFFYALFPMPGLQGYQVLDFGKYLSIFFLDSNHTNTVKGPQSAWLQRSLQARQEVPFKAAIYHVPAYPSVGSFNNSTSALIRSNWVPLFEQYGIDVAFEHHAHAYKRTHLIKEGRISSDGVLYIGDGAWGVENLRKPHSPKNTWYLAKTLSVNHFILTTIDQTHLYFQAIDSRGKIIDEFYP